MCLKLLPFPDYFSDVFTGAYLKMKCFGTMKNKKKKLYLRCLNAFSTRLRFKKLDEELFLKLLQIALSDIHLALFKVV